MIENMIPTQEEVSELLRRGWLEGRGRTWTIRPGALEALRAEHLDRPAPRHSAQISPLLAGFIGAGLMGLFAVLAVLAS